MGGCQYGCGRIPDTARTGSPAGIPFIRRTGHSGSRAVCDCERQEGTGRRDHDQTGMHEGFHAADRNGLLYTSQQHA